MTHDEFAKAVRTVLDRPENVLARQNLIDALDRGTLPLAREYIVRALKVAYENGVEKGLAPINRDIVIE